MRGTRRSQRTAQRSRRGTGFGLMEREGKGDRGRATQRFKRVRGGRRGGIGFGVGERELDRTETFWLRWNRSALAVGEPGATHGQYSRRWTAS